MDQDLKAIGTLLDKKLGEKLDQKLSPIKTKLNEISEKVDSHSASLMKIEQEIGAYKEGLELQKERIDKHETRLTNVEDNLNLVN